jgi:hypothetical protein
MFLQKNIVNLKHESFCTKLVSKNAKNAEAEMQKMPLPWNKILGFHVMKHFFCTNFLVEWSGVSRLFACISS